MMVDYQQSIKNQQFSRRRLRLRRDFLQDLSGNFLQCDAELEHGCFCTASPAGDLPVRADEFHVWVLSEVEQQRRLARIELLAESGDRLRLPGRTVCRTEDADVERFLLNDPGDYESA